MSSNREGISRFFGKQEASDSQFLIILKELLPFIKKGYFDSSESDKIDIVEKMDSSFFQIGINDDGKFFVQTSNSPEVTKDNVEQYFKTEVTKDFKEAFLSLEKNDKIQKALKNIHKKFKAFKIDCEVFPVLTHQGDQSGYVIFNATKYDKSKFGSDGALVLFKVWIKDENNSWVRPSHKISNEIIEKVTSASNEKWKIYNNENLKIPVTIDLSEVKNLLPTYLQSERDIDKALEELKAKNRSFALKLKKDLQPLKIELQKQIDIIANSQSSVFSKEGDTNPIEGVVLRIKDESGKTIEVKGTSEVFQAQKEKIWKTRNKISQLEEELTTIILQDVYNISANDKELNTLISGAVDNFVPTKNDPKEIENEFLSYLIQQITQKPVESISLEGVYALIRKAEDDIETTENELKSENYDPDTTRKSYDSLQSFTNKVKQIKNILNSNASDAEKVVGIFKELLNRKLDKRAGKFLHYQSVSNESGFSQYYKNLTPVIIWVGRAQPWHIGHHQMIELAKSKFSEIGANAVLIILVKGGKTSSDVDKNPLSERDQYEMLYSLYEKDNEVLIAKNSIPTANIINILNEVVNNKCYIVGFLAGEDRIEDYKKMFIRFNANFWIKDHDYLPLKVKNDGSHNIEFILTPRVMSGTEAREMTKHFTFEEWIKKVLPIQISINTVKVYKKMYEKIKSLKENEILYEKIYNIFYGKQILLEREPLNKQKKSNNQEQVQDVQDEKPEDIKNDDEKIEDVGDDKAEELQSERGVEDVGSDDAQDIEDKKDQIQDVGDDETDKEQQSSEEIKPFDDDTYELSDDGKQIIRKEDGDIVDFETVDVNGKKMVKLDDEIVDIEVGEDGKLKPGNNKRPIPSPEDIPDDDDDNRPDDQVIEDIKLKLPKFTSIKDPELYKKILKSIAGGLWDTFLWLSSGHSQEGTAALQSITDKVGKLYKDLVNKIKTGKIKAAEAQQLLLKNKGKFSQKFKVYDDMKKETLKKFEDNKENFNKVAENRRMNIYLGVKENEKENKSEMSQGEMIMLALKNMIQDLEKTKSEKQETIDKIKEIHKMYSNMSKEKVSQILTVEEIHKKFKEKGVKIHLFDRYLNNVISNKGYKPSERSSSGDDDDDTINPL